MILRLLMRASILLLTCAPAAYGQASAPPSGVAAGELARAPMLDGVLNAEEWAGATKFELSYQTFPGENVKPTERTECFVAYDKEHLYFAFHAFDSDAAAIRARVTRRDDVQNDDFITIWLDTYDDRRRAYLFRFNPLGIQADGIYTESDTDNLTWDGILESKGAITTDGYVIEVAVPFKTMRFQAGKSWGLQVIRKIARKDERAAWQPLSRDRADFLIQMGRLTGLDGIYGGRTLDLNPTLTLSANGEREAVPLNTVGGTTTTGARLNNVNRFDPGLTATYTLTPNLIVAATINPDFSQIEADVPQVSVNQRFPLFFPEKRPFFLEGTEVFRSFYPAAPRLVDTRQIVDPDWGVKLTGKIGRNSIGFLSASDRAPGLNVSTDDSDYARTFGKKALYNIFRFQRDVGKQTSIGAVLTDRRFAGSSNSLFAIDARTRLKEKHLIALQIAQTWTRNVFTDSGVTGATTTSDTLSYTSTKGGAIYFVYNFDGRTWDFGGSDSHVARDYRPGAGFQARTGYDRDYVYIGYTFRPEKPSWYVSIHPQLIGFLLREPGNVNRDAYFDQSVEVVLPRGISFSLLNSIDRDRFSGRDLPYHFYGGSFDITRFKRATFGGNLYLGTGINYDPGNPAIGKRFDGELRIGVKPNNKLNSEFLFLRSSLASRVTGAQFFEQNILRNRTIYQFTRWQAVRAIVDYDTAGRQFGASVLYAYTPKPNTALYFGYSDLLYNGFDPLEERRAAGLFRLRRTLFMKASYNFRF